MSANLGNYRSTVLHSTYSASTTSMSANPGNYRSTEHKTSTVQVLRVCANLGNYRSTAHKTSTVRVLQVRLQIKTTNISFNSFRHSYYKKQPSFKKYECYAFITHIISIRFKQYFMFFQVQFETF